MVKKEDDSAGWVEKFEAGGRRCVFPHLQFGLHAAIICQMVGVGDGEGGFNCSSFGSGQSFTNKLNK